MTLLPTDVETADATDLSASETPIGPRARLGWRARLGGVCGPTRERSPRTDECAHLADRR